MKKTSSVVSRRQFLDRSAKAVALFSVVSPHVLGLHGATSPNEKLNIAGIGIGGQGGSDLSNMTSENIVALCDVDWAHADHTFKQYPNAKRYKDFRKMLEEQKEIDAVVVATPDHLHAAVSMRAIKLGKHVYCEKPLTYTVHEARTLAKAAAEAKVATQMGNQGQASEETRRLCEYMEAGAVGNVKEVHIWTDRPNNGLLGEYWPQGVRRPKDTPAVPDTMDWDMWLGPAPYRPYHPAYCPFKWRGWLDFGTGALGDIGCHAMDPVFRALKLGAPISVEATSTRVNEDTYPLGSIVKYEFPARGNLSALSLTWYDGGLRPMRPAELKQGKQMGANNRLIIGDKGVMLGGELIPDNRQREFSEPARSIPRSPGHYIEWIQACKGGKPGGSNFSFAGPLTESVLLGNIALRMSLREEMDRMKLLWDSQAFKFTNLADANAYLQREYRKGWSL